jgi:hypothetical protein
MPTPQTLKRAWEIHQNADILLHNRLSAFAIAQSFLVSSERARLRFIDFLPGRRAGAVY